MSPARTRRDQFIARTFGSQKLGNSPEEFEDAYDLSGDRCPASRIARYAVADGATTSAFAREWAQMLVRDFVRNPMPYRTLRPRIEALQPQWSQMLSGLSLPWYAEEQARRGAFATLLGLSLHGRKRSGDAAAGSWTAGAVGDSCLFQVRGSHLIESFPIRSSSEFGDRPPLLSSRAIANQSVWQAERKAAGEWQPADRFYLMTDALAAWFLRLSEQDLRPWETLDALAGPDPTGRLSLATWIDEQRATRAIRNDDVTLLIVEVVGDGIPSTSAG